jgi:small subunit ribosomal protein S16
LSVRVRLTRVGSKKNPIWRIVVADQRSPRDGRFIEMLGHYNPQTEPSEVKLDRERLDHWLARGAQPTNTVRKLLRADVVTPAEAATDADAAPPVQEPAEPEAEAPAAEAAAEGQTETPAG